MEPDQRRTAGRHLPVRRRRCDVAQALRAWSAERPHRTHRPRGGNAFAGLCDRAVARRRPLAIRRRRRHVAPDAARSAGRRATVLFQHARGRSGGSRSFDQRRARAFDEHQRRPHVSRDRDGRRLGLSRDVVVGRRAAHRQRQRRGRHSLRRRRHALLAAVRSAVRAAVSRRARRRASELSHLHRPAGRQLVVRRVVAAQRHRRDESRLGPDRARRRHVGADRSARSAIRVVDVRPTTIRAKSFSTTGARSRRRTCRPMRNPTARSRRRR